ncbi:hypothetical protein [Hallella colorans]|uniref:hypothetical protein n=1 Tax=Hallella colorans TaxID=1703337 RepID=UPI000E30A453|nr:hypothetical protein [Hallella colorans]
MGYPLPLDRIDTLKTGRFARFGEMGVLNAGPEAEWSVHGVADAATIRSFSQRARRASTMATKNFSG